MLLSFLSLSFLVFARQSVDTYGKTEAQVLSMGSSAWHDFYIGKAGSSTAFEANAYEIYADIADKRNRLLLSDPKLPHREAIRQLDKLLIDFGHVMIDFGSEITGGGTMWNPIGASQYADSEDTIYRVIHSAGQPKPAKVVVSDVTKAMDKIPGGLKKESTEGVVTKDQLKAAPRQLQEAKALYMRIVKLAATFDRPTSDRILGFCLDQAKLPTTAWGG